MLWSINMKKTKKGPLSNKEKKYIENNLDSIKSDADKVAELMNRSVATIAKYINSLPKKEEAKTIKPGDLIARNEEMGVTVMTESASMAGDESKKQRKPNQNPERYTQYIHKIKE